MSVDKTTINYNDDDQDDQTRRRAKEQDANHHGEIYFLAIISSRVERPTITL